MLCLCCRKRDGDGACGRQRRPNNRLERYPILEAALPAFHSQRYRGFLQFPRRLLVGARVQRRVRSK